MSFLSVRTPSHSFSLISSKPNLSECIPSIQDHQVKANVAEINAWLIPILHCAIVEILVFVIRSIIPSGPITVRG